MNESGTGACRTPKWRKSGSVVAALAFVFAMFDPGFQITDGTLRDFALKGRVHQVRMEESKASKYGDARADAPAVLFESLEFNEAGKLLQKTYYNSETGKPGNTITFQYDDSGRATRILWTLRERVVSGMNFTYPPGSDRALSMLRVYDQKESRWQYEYDAAGRLMRETTTEADGSPAGEKLHEYDSSGRAAKVLWQFSAAGLQEERFQYLQDGSYSRTEVYADAREEYRYSPDGALFKRRITRVLPLASITTEEWNYRYEYDAAGNWTRQDEYLCHYPYFLWPSCEQVATYHRTITYYPAAGH